MNKRNIIFLFIITTILALNGCGQTPSPTIAPAVFTPASISPTLTPVLSIPTITPIPKGKTIIVTNADDGGAGTLRQVLLDAENGDTIIFDATVFPPTNPTTIYVTSELPLISQGDLTIDASNAGVILNGNNVPAGGWEAGLQMVSDGNTIQGLQVINFPGAGIAVSGGQHNRIGGDRSIGLGPLGQGNLTSGNDIGIGLWGNASRNTVTGNLVGTYPDGVEAWGNRSGGVLIIEGANHNVIGPDNVITYNGVGIEIHDTSSLGNTVVQNSIYHNGWIGILLWAGGNKELTAPVILNSDLSTGIVTGTACGDCTIEIFSDAGGEGQIFEGQTTADSSGVFTFEHDSPLVGPRLTGIATDTEGNTSPFSAPTSGAVIPAPLQTGNDLSTSVFQTRQSRNLADNRIATLTSPDLVPRESYDRFLTAIWANLGLKRIRLSFNEIEPPVDWSKPEFPIDSSDDNWINSIVSHNIAITYVLTFWDKDYQASGKEVICPRFKTEDEIQRYLNYVQFIVRHFKDRIQYYEIWNEQDNKICPQWIEVNDYINLVRRTVPVIHQEYPGAKVVIGGTIGLHAPSSQDYLFAILNSDVMPMVDVVAWHPFYGASPQYDDVREYFYAYPSLVQKIKDVASASGFIGEYRADEMTWRTAFNALADQPWTYSETIAAKYYARGIVMHLGMDVSAGIMPDSRFNDIDSVIRNLGTIMAGAKPASLTVEIQSEVTNIMSYSFSLPNGDQLFALWTNGKAIDNDPGIPSTLTIPGFADLNAKGIDILNGFEQELISTSEDGNLIIRGFLLKDYPILIRLSK